MKSIPEKFKGFYILTSLCASIILIYLVVITTWSTEFVTHFLVFSFLAIASESLPVALPNGGYVSVSYAVFMAALISTEPSVGVFSAALGGLLVLGKDAMSQPYWKRIFNASQFIISMTLSLFALNILGISSFNFTFNNFLYFCFTASIYILSNVTFVSVALGKLMNKSPWSIWVGNIRWSVPNFLALVPLGLLMSMIYNNYGPIALFLLFIPLLLTRHSFQLYMDMRKNYLNTVEALVQALEAKDAYTSGHSSRVAEWSVKLGQELNLPEDRLEFIKYAGVLHDVGKIGVSESVLNKEGKLTDQEWEVIREHPVIGQNIIKSIDFLFDVGQAVRYHHERYDGAGYPEGIAGEVIPLESRIIAVADTYDSMTSDRSYRKGLTHGEAIAELKRVAGTQLDPKIVGAFLSIIQQEEQSAHTTEKSTDGLSWSSS
jgi:hypothetical protein